MTEIRTTSRTGGEKGVKLERLDLLPVEPLLAVARLFGKGAAKYDDHNWRKGYEWSKSYASMQRHALAFWSGQDVDEHEPDCPDDCTQHTEELHLAAVIFHAMALIEWGVTHPEFDDRYRPSLPSLEQLVQERARLIAAGVNPDHLEIPIATTWLGRYGGES